VKPPAGFGIRISLEETPILMEIEEKAEGENLV
jgi:hypothetical protein